ncbi:unnamed protein product, partial [Ectocarpus sp. 6 AP-2014]
AAHTSECGTLRLFDVCSWLRIGTLLEDFYIFCCLVWVRMITLHLGLTLGLGPTQGEG